MKKINITLSLMALVVVIGGGVLVGKYLPNISNEAYLAASYQNRIGSFSLQKISYVCNSSNAPVVSLSWSTANNATSYTIQRVLSPSTKWTVTGQVNATSYTDDTWTSDYPVGTYKYSVTAKNRTSSLTSNSLSMSIQACNTVIGTSTGPVVTPTPTSTPTTTPPVVVTTPTNRVLWGAMTGTTKAQFDAFQTTIGRTADHTATFVHWGNENQFPVELGSGLTSNQSLIIFWEAMDYNFGVDQPKFNYDAIVRGDWDNYIKSFDVSAKAYGKPVIIVLFEEMNSDWYPWSITMNGNNAAKHILAYQHVRDFFRDAPNVKFAWDYNDDSIPDVAGNRPQDFYPGANYVDIVGVDSFNFGTPWETMAQMVDDPLATARTFGKPIYIMSFAAAEDSRKPGWITDALSTYIPAHPEIKGWVWFNENKEKNWLIWSSAQSLSAFQAALPK